MVYKNKYTTIDDKIYVYLSVATYDYFDNNVYKGFSMDDNDLIYKKEIDTQNDDELNAEVKENYQKYAQYKMIFEKNDKGTYSFKTIEEL